MGMTRIGHREENWELFVPLCAESQIDAINDGGGAILFRRPKNVVCLVNTQAPDVGNPEVVVVSGQPKEKHVAPGGVFGINNDHIGVHSQLAGPHSERKRRASLSSNASPRSSKDEMSCCSAARSASVNSAQLFS